MQMLLPTIAYVVVVGLAGIYVASAIFIGAFMIWKGRYRLLAALSVAIGVTLIEKGDNAATVLARADKAMYRVKAAA